MRTLRTMLFLAAVLLVHPAPAKSQASQPSADTPAILKILNKSVDDWNHGDIEAFATCYKNSPDILFMGRTIQHGYAQMLARYKSAYPTPAAMGTLTFTDLSVQRLDAHFATATGNFHLERTAAGGGNANGYFLLVLERTPAGWKIVRDATTPLPPPAAK
jgi:ketosteroid isomerase-like protein